MFDVCVKIFDVEEDAELFKSFMEGHGIDSDIVKCLSDQKDIYKLMVNVKDKLEAFNIVEETFMD